MTCRTTNFASFTTYSARPCWPLARRGRRTVLASSRLTGGMDMSGGRRSNERTGKMTWLGERQDD